jgi:Family of unknown function (DUF6263)
MPLSTCSRSRSSSAQPVSSAIVSLLGLVIAFRIVSASTGGPCAAAVVPPTRQPVIAERPQASPAYDLRYKFHAGKDVHMVVDFDSQIRVQKGQAVTVAKMQSCTERHFHVVSVEPNGSAVLDLVMDNVRMSRSFDDKAPVVYDTRSSDLPTSEFQAVKDSVGSVLAQMEATDRGEMRSLVVRENLSNSRRIMTTDANENFLDILPDKPIRTGDEWSDDIKVSIAVTRSLQQKITLRRRYTLESVHGSVATIHLRTTELAPTDDPMVRAQLVQKTPEGTILFDMDLGMVTSRKLCCSRTETGIMGEGSVIGALSNLSCQLK